MKRDMYLEIEKYMLLCMNDVAHDSQHVYRVLYHALDIATEYITNLDVLIAASLLHDIGRDEQFKNPENDHAIVGSQMAFEFLLEIGWDKNKADHVKNCIATHRFRNNNPPESIEQRFFMMQINLM